MSDQKLPSVVGKKHADLLAMAAAEGVGVADGIAYKDLQAAILAHRAAATAPAAPPDAAPPAVQPVAAPPPTPAPKAKAARYWVTAGNIAHDADGKRRTARQSIRVDGEAAEALLAAKIITTDEPAEPADEVEDAE